jgi:hypothetical protein
VGDVVVGLLDMEARSGHRAAQRSVAAMCPSLTNQFQQIDRGASLSVSRSLDRSVTFAKFAPAVTGACLGRLQTVSMEVSHRG